MRMKFTAFTSLLAALSLAIVARATASPQVGDTYEITLTRDSAQQGSNGSSGSSHDQDAIIERVNGLRADGLELEYDLPNTVTSEERASVWQYPARVFKPIDGPEQLLNGQELEARIDNWLKAAAIPRSACGHWIFTWNAFRIECNPQSVIETIAAFDLRTAPLREGASYQDPEGRGTGKLIRKVGTPDSAGFEVEVPVDPDFVRRANAESDVAVGEILRKPVTYEAALRERSNEAVSGTISIEFQLDADGEVRRRTKVTKVEIKKPDGQSEKNTVTEILERRLISRTP